MTSRLPLTILAVLAVSAATAPMGSSDSPHPSASDSAVAEFEAGRFWHAARMLRAEGAAGGEPADVLLLARAEAGWHNWPGVRGLLSGAEWLAEDGNEAGLYLLGRSLEDAEDWEESAEAYEAYAILSSPSGPEHQAALARAVRTRWVGGDREEALAILSRPGLPSGVRSWISLELTADVSDSGDLAALDELLAHVSEPAALDATWRLRPEALLEAGDSTAADAAFEALRETNMGTRQALATVELGRLRLAVGDTLAARPLLLEAFEEASRAVQARAAAPLSDLGSHELDLTLRLARALDRAGDGRRALRGYDRVVSMSEGVDAPMSMRVERARLMGTVRSRQEEAIEEFRAIREQAGDAAIGARNLELWAQLRRRQGLGGHVNTLRRWLIEEHPASGQAAEVMWTRANSAETGGRLDSALEQYALLVENARTHARAGQARMRSGQIHLGREQRARAVEVYEEYLRDFPIGRRWQEASYWAGRIRMELGDSAAANEHIERIWRGDPVSYYAVMGADLLGVAYEMDVPAAEVAPVPAWMSEGLARLDVYTEAGLDRGSAAEISHLSERARATKNDQLALAEALIARGRTIDGINLGWALRDDGHEWDARLIRVAFPFPYRELVRREAEEWGLDPIVMAAIIRQESAFKADIVSRAGAIGLMQVMPPTGAQLARAHGPDGFRADNLTAPEVNLHLGAAFFVEMSARYDGDLPLVLSAYNAGPTRANRWRRYPEVADPLRFTERIPFVETRGYVKNVRRNLGLYRVLYGQD